MTLPRDALRTLPLPASPGLWRPDEPNARPQGHFIKAGLGYFAGLPPADESRRREAKKPDALAGAGHPVTLDEKALARPANTWQNTLARSFAGDGEPVIQVLQPHPTLVAAAAAILASLEGANRSPNTIAGYSADLRKEGRTSEGWPAPRRVWDWGRLGAGQGAMAALTG